MNANNKARDDAILKGFLSGRKPRSLIKEFDLSEHQIKKSIHRTSMDENVVSHETLEIFREKGLPKYIILEKEQIVSNAEKRFSVILGVYFLIADREIVYVGQSQNILDRLGKHHLEGRINFDEYFILPCEKEDLVNLETIYIRKFNPKYNQQNDLRVNVLMNLDEILKKKDAEFTGLPLFNE